MMNKSVYLVNAGNDQKYCQGVVHGASFPPLGVISLATAVQQSTDWDVKVFDGLVTDEQEILESIQRNRPGIVGVSVLATSYQNALNLARAAKEAGAVTIFGNDQATITGRHMLTSRQEIDYICTADAGERPFVQFLEYVEGKREISDVAKLMYRQDGEVKHNLHLAELESGDRFSVLDQIAIPDRSLIPKEVRELYLANYRAAYPDEEVTGTGTINRFRGCARVKDPCCYCGIADLTIRASSPEVFWEDVRAAREIGANRLFEAGDSVSSVPRYLERLVAAKPEGLEWGAFVYTSARETSPKLAELYQKLGVFRANMGLDSGDPAMLSRLKGPRDTMEQSRKAVELLSQAGINIYSSFVLGGPGETRESLENTVAFTKWLIDEKLVDGTEAQPLFPEINARSGRLILNPAYAEQRAAQEGWQIRNRKLLHAMPEKWGNHENPDPVEISKDWAAIFSELPYGDLLAVAAQIREYSRKNGILTGSSWIVRNDEDE